MENGTNGILKDAQVRPMNPELPIVAYAQEIQEAALVHDSLVIIGETGSGKTTRLPLILREIIGPEDKVAITQPRRVAARSVAKYVADQVGSRIGQEVGYAVRFDDQTTEGTKINFMTDGILLRKIQEDPLLAEYSVVMVDEVHERSLNIDFTLGLLKRLQTQRAAAGMAPLKIIVTSATLEKEKLATYFDGSPVVEIPGRMYPVEVHYEEKPVYDYPSAAAEKAYEITTSGKEGDVLIFMPGVDEINKTIASIRQRGIADAEILPLHGQLSPEEQDRVFAQSTRRKIIVATNIAETSVTVVGVRHVIDSGLIKQTEFDAQTGIGSLATQPHAQSGCIQRAGRAGRVAPGDCYRLYTEADFEARRKFQLPEIQRSNLAQVVLTMKKVGIDDVESFNFIDQPDTATLHQAVETLKTLGALDDQGVITEIGRVMSELPLEPHIARMVIEAQKHGCVEQVCTIAAFLGGRSVLNRPKGTEYQADQAHREFKDSSSDFLTFLNVWKSYEASHFNDYWARDNFLNSRTLGEVREIRQQLFRAMKRNGIDLSSSENSDAIGQSVAAGLVENLMEYRGSHSYRRVKDGVTGFFIHPSSAIFGGDARLIVPAEIVKTSKTFARACQVVKPEWISAIAPQFTTEVPRNASYDPVSDTVVRSVDVRLKGSVDLFSAGKREVEGAEAVKAFADALAAGTVDVPFAQANLDVLKTATDLYVRSGGQIPKPLSLRELVDMYCTRLGTVSSRAGLVAAIESGEMNLHIQLREFVEPEAQVQIMTDNPDSIVLNGVSYPLRYSNIAVSDKPFPIRISVPADEVMKLQAMPHIPSGRQIIVQVIDKVGSPFQQFEGIDLDVLQKRSRDLINKTQWNTWYRSQPEGLVQQVLSNFDVTGDIPALPEKMLYGTDPQTGESLYAYPACMTKKDMFGNDHFYIQFYAAEVEATQAQDHTQAVIREALYKRQIQQAKEVLVPAVRKFEQEVLVQLASITYLNYGAYNFTKEEYLRLKSDLATATAQIERDPSSAHIAFQKIQDVICVKLQQVEIDRVAREQSIAESNAMAQALRQAGLVSQVADENNDFSYTPIQKGQERKIGPNRNDQNRSVWEAIETSDQSVVLELATSKTPKDIRIAELATVRALISMPWSKLQTLIIRIDSEFPHLAGATKRITTLGSAITNGRLEDEVSQRILAEASQFAVLKPAISIAQQLIPEWVGDSLELQERAFSLFIKRLGNATIDDTEIADEITRYKHGQSIPQSLQDLFIECVEEL